MAATRTSRQATVRRRAVRRRRVLALLGIGALTVFAIAVVEPVFHHAVKEVVLPLRHEDIIRQQAHEKNLDPALVAAVIYTESRFRDQTSHAGAKGLMQLTPDTAKFVEHLSGGSTFQVSDLSTPQVNIAYGTYYLRYLLKRYSGNEFLALAAYNAGEGRVDQWIFDARHRGEEFDHARHIPFPETRHYVQQVLEMRGRYRERYKQELGL